MRVKIRCDMNEASTQRRTKARHDPATLRVVQETFGQKSSQHSEGQEGVIPLHLILRAVMRRKRLWRKKELRVTMMRSKEKPRYKPHPKKNHKSHASNKAKRLHVHLPNTSKE
jgi:hypothetical protein